MKKWNPTVKLDMLLDALEAEILAASDAEIQAAVDETGMVGAATLRQLKALITAEADGVGTDRHLPPVVPNTTDGTRRHRVWPDAFPSHGPDRTR